MCTYRYRCELSPHICLTRFQKYAMGGHVHARASPFRPARVSGRVPKTVQGLITPARPPETVRMAGPKWKRDGFKVCRKCEKQLDLPEFFGDMHPDDWDGRILHCFECRNPHKDVEYRENVVDKITRKVWPKSRNIRYKKIASVLPIALRDYDGRIPSIADALNLPLHEIRDVIEAHDRLKKLHEQCDAELLDKIEDRYITDALDGKSHTARQNILKARRPEKYSDKQQLVITEGFAPPPKSVRPEEMTSVLGVQTGIQRKKETGGDL